MTLSALDGVIPENKVKRQLMLLIYEAAINEHLCSLPLAFVNTDVIIQSKY